MKKVFIQYFLNEIYLGAGYVVEADMDKDRRSLARSMGINYYNRFILDRGRVDTKRYRVPKEKNLLDDFGKKIKKYKIS